MRMQKPMATPKQQNMARSVPPIYIYIYIYISIEYNPLGPHAYLQRCPYEQCPGVVLLQFLQRLVLNFGDKSVFDFMDGFKLLDAVPVKNAFKSAMSEFSSSWFCTGAAPVPPVAITRLAPVLFFVFWELRYCIIGENPGTNVGSCESEEEEYMAPLTEYLKSVEDKWWPGNCLRCTPGVGSTSLSTDF